MDWIKVKLVEIAEEKRENYEPTADEHLNYIGLEHIEQQTLRLNGIGDSRETISSKRRFNSGDILFGSLRPYFRKVYKPKFNGVCSTDITVINSKQNFSQDYLFYLIANQAFIDYATNFSNGTRMPRANWKVISDSEWFVPKEKKDQQKIASTLSAYDDLIENNTRRIQILEQMAQVIYKEWFVNFRFPGYEKVKFVDSKLDKIPKGWEVVELQEFGDIVTGKTPSTKVPEYFGDEIPFIKTPDMHSNIFIFETTQYLSKKGGDLQSKKYIPPRSICVSCIGTVGVVSINSILAQTNQQINTVICKRKEYIEFLFYSVSAMKEVLEAYGANGATMANVNKEKFSSLSVLKPSESLIEQFHLLTEVMFDEIEKLLFKNKNLRKTRDLLLPKLLSVEVDV
jgi:type I restriction enzyme S subunit